MIEPWKVNAIWDLLEPAKLALYAKGRTRIKTSDAVDFIIAHVVADGAIKVTREEVLEAWLYQALHQIMANGGIEPLPPRAS